MFLFQEKIAAVIANARFECGVVEGFTHGKCCFSRDPGLTIQWFLGQVRLDHLFMDVLSFEYVWVRSCFDSQRNTHSTAMILQLALLCASVVGVFVHLFVFEPFIKPKHAPADYVREMERGEAAYMNNLMRFVTET